MLVALLLPAVQSARESGRRVQCLNNLKQDGVALLHYYDERSAFPVGNQAPNPNSAVQQGGWWGFQAQLLPYLESKYIYELCNFTYQGTCFDWITAQQSFPSKNPAIQILGYYHCPDDPHSGDKWSEPGQGAYGCTNYQGVMGTTEFANDGILLHRIGNQPFTLQEITDGASHTIIMGERGLSNQLYGWPYCGAGDDYNTGWGDNLMATILAFSAGRTLEATTITSGATTRLVHFLFADAVIPLTYDIDNTIYQAYATKAGKEIVPEP